MTFTTYEDRLNANFDWALREGSLHFENRSLVHETMRRFSQRLDDMGIPYAVAGGMALFFHGYRRYTEDADILVTGKGLGRIERELPKEDYLPSESGRRRFRDTETGVRIDLLVTGRYPGDGKPKSVAFPHPSDASERMEGIAFLTLPQLLTLKLASGMTHRGRMRNLADAQELIAAVKLPKEFVDRLDPFVDETYLDLWQIIQDYPDFDY